MAKDVGEGSMCVCSVYISHSVIFGRLQKKEKRKIKNQNKKNKKKNKARID